LVFDDYAENIQRNSGKILNFLANSSIFASPNRFFPVFSGFGRLRMRIRQTAIPCQRGSNRIKNRPVADTIETTKPAPA
jgi:hypothetical protein